MMISNKKIGRIAGVLLLVTFISGIIVFQFLQSSILSTKDYVIAASESGNELILSTLLSFFGGILSILVAIILLPVFKKQHYNLAFLYLTFCILNFVAIAIDNYSVVSMLEFSKASVKNSTELSSVFEMMKTLIYRQHIWTHYFYLLISCLPVFVLFYTLYVSKLVPRVLSGFGLFAVIMMLIHVLGTFFGEKISTNMMIPIALIQLVFPIWLLFKGMKELELKSIN
jgi:hypothetical protein